MSKRALQASKQGIKIANTALVRNQQNIQSLATDLCMSRSTVSKFFNGRPVDRRNFLEICDKLSLTWEDIVEKELVANQEVIVHSAVGDVYSDTDSVKATVLFHELSNTHKENLIKGQEVNTESKTQLTVVKLQGKLIANINIQLKEELRVDINDQIQFEDILVDAQSVINKLENTLNASFQLRDIKEGCVRLILEGSPDDLKRLKELFKTRQLIELLGLPIDNVTLIAKGQDLSNIDLSGANLSDADLRSTNLSNANLKNANLSNIRLSRAILIGADLSNTNLSGADLGDANLSNANLNDANLSDADLSGTNLSGVKINDATQLNSKWRRVWEIVNQGAKGQDLHNADLSDANLSNADLSNANLNSANLNLAVLIGTQLNNVDLRNADLSSANLRRADLSGAYLQDVIIDEQTQIDDKWHLVWEILNLPVESRNLESANLKGANLKGANLKNAVLVDTNLESTNLQYANLDGALLVRTNLIHADLVHAHLVGADLIRADLEGADLAGASLLYAKLPSAFLVDANLEGTNLKYINLVRAFLVRANLKGANLEGANLMGAVLWSANLEGANLKGAVLWSANLEGVNLKGAIVKNALFVHSSGLTDEEKLELASQGAIFDFGDSSPVPTNS